MKRPALLVIVRHAESVRNQVKKDAVYFADDAARRVVRGSRPPDRADTGRPRTGGADRQVNPGAVGVFDYVYTSGRPDRQTAEGSWSAYTDEERARPGTDELVRPNATEGFTMT